MKVGDICWVELPPADGHEQTGRRPVVIVQDEEYAGHLPVVLVIPLTTARASLRFPGTLLIQPTPQNGLREPSVALVFQMRAIDRGRLREQMGTLSTEVITALFGTLDRMLGRSPS